MVECAGQWYLIGLHGDMVLRVRQGMPLGETEAGELSFDPSCAQLEFGIADDGGLMLSAVDDHELEFAGGARRRHECLARDRRPEIRLPHNVLRLVTDFVDPAQANETVEVRPVRPVEQVVKAPAKRSPEAPVRLPEAPVRLPEAPVRLPEARVYKTPDAVVVPPPSRTARVARRLATSAADASRVMRLLVVRPLLRVPHRVRSSVEMVRDRLRDPRAAWVVPPQWRIRGASMAALVAVTGLALALLYAAFRDDAALESAAAIDVSPAPRTEPTQTPLADVVSSEPRIDAVPSFASLPNPELLPAVDTRSSTEPENRAPEPVSSAPEPERRAPARASRDDEPASGAKVAERLADPLPQPAPAVAVVEPAVTPPVERPSIPEVAANVGVDALAEPQSSDAPPDAIAASNAEEVSATTQRQAVELARVLFAADQALAEGRLTTPAEANAYTLFSRVLSLDPESAAGRKGVQSVRQRLINRAMAQLASGALEDARSSLQSAADAGADPMLIANLRDEVEYRQRLVDGGTAQTNSQDQEPR